ncbi:hypothetical protein LTR91_002957 [Friedmanniomyces endolithicus]|uniref:Uncharacterized protein n=1 Tax=Friedmanniomyces endolithicus TaxID=329885 RepID=A0AAN6KY62_9PEZI|nr:hypothetical protein LTR94_015713 [Friedmanniomyces endolithicus]KAK0770101.1 hypothetical protein LTR59_016665 [Friedmanniomyces endolithicus]KAK0777867.1 hypothetical protein LTR38_015000 [Friedmanniomyces endolithicus]KAK0814504.1 hypothetical protein LTR75_004212 [Friedmanniomyces endolithicus]KAK0850540.1 hypothetical protein LTR03_004512 [Friedmanniomyces endolithicus]
MLSEAQDLLSALDFTTTDHETYSFASSDTPKCDLDVEQLEVAATAGDLEAVKSLTDKIKRSRGAQRATLPSGSALMFAVDCGRKDVVEYLLSEGLTVHTTHVKVATINRDTAVLELLFTHGWDVNTPIEWCVPPALAFAVEDSALVDWFLANGADPNARCLLDTTPLSAAVEFASLPTIQRLLDQGGSVACGQLMHYALRRKSNDRLQIMEYLLQQPSPPPVCKLMYEDEPWWFESQKFFGLGTPLHDAAASGDLDAVRFLMANGSDPSIKDSLGKLAIEKAHKHGHDSVVLFLRSRSDQSTSSPTAEPHL